MFFSTRNHISNFRLLAKSINLLCFLLYAMVFCNPTLAVGGTELNVTLVNGISNTPLTNMMVHARERFNNGSSQWVAKATTDSSGHVIFDLERLGQGRNYYLLTKPYNGGWVNSVPVTRAGDFRFPVGTFEVRVVSGANGSKLSGITVNVRERLNDGTTKPVSGAISDTDGIIQFDIPGLGKGRTYYLSAKSPVTGNWTTTENIFQAGQYTFKLGNAPLNVKLVNGISGTPLANMTIHARERFSNGDSQWVAKAKTDRNGHAIFDLDGLGQNRNYYLLTKPYNGGWVNSGPVTQAGNFRFPVGTFEVRVVSGANGAKLPSIAINVRERLSNGTTKQITRAITDANGIIQFDIPGLGKGHTYYLSAKSPVNDTWTKSGNINQAGRYTFKLGNSPLNVTLVNGISNTPLANMEIHIRERFNDGSSQWIAKASTDRNGRAIFDLEGIGQGHNYYLLTKPYNGGWVNSGPVTRAGDFRFPVGTFEVRVVSGANGSKLSNIAVNVRERLNDGTTRPVTEGTTDTNGIIRFDLEGLGKGHTYYLGAKSPVDGKWAISENISQVGQHTFKLGNIPLNVTLLNGISNVPLANLTIHVREQLSNGTTQWTAKAVTNSIGHAIFDLERLGQGRNYYLLTKPYNGGWVRSRILNNTDDYIFRVGTLPVTLRDTTRNRPLSGHRLTILEKGEDGKLQGRVAGVTDQTGTVHFDLSGIDKGLIYTARTENVFGNGKVYFSPWISTEGAVDFTITPIGDYSKDTTPPSVKITEPTDGALVSDTGFMLRGQASDNKGVAKIIVSVVDPLTGSHTATAKSFANGRWNFPVDHSMLSSDANVTIQVSAFDRMENKTVTTLGIKTINDNAKPTVQILSHQNGDRVADNGILVSGIVNDNTSVKQLVAIVEDPVKGRVVNNKPISIARSSGRWSLAVRDLSPGKQVTVKLIASDYSGNIGTDHRSLNIVQVTETPIHLINRITFGATPKLLYQAEQLGYDGFLERQLNPLSIDDSEVEAILADIPVPLTRKGLQSSQLIRAIYSKRQLNEIMTWFWDNHFSTDRRKTWTSDMELTENEMFRRHALGNFRDLLQVSATSPAMLIYLDNNYSHKKEPNENYARELMELHTLGVDGGYSALDVAEVARVFTGWTVYKKVFHFRQSIHDDDEKRVLGHLIPAGSDISGGEQVLDILASHPSTARFICTKLLNLFVSDSPTQLSVTNCADQFLASDGNIGFVVKAILQSPDFMKSTRFHSKFKTPLEFLTGLMRKLQPRISYNELTSKMNDMGMLLFHNPLPTGWSEHGKDWASSDQLLQRILFVNNMTFQKPNKYRTHLINPTSLFLTHGYETAEGVAGYLFQLALANDYSKKDWNTAISILTDDGATPFDIHAEDADQRIRELIATISNLPSYQLQ